MSVRHLLGQANWKRTDGKVAVVLIEGDKVHRHFGELVNSVKSVKVLLSRLAFDQRDLAIRQLSRSSWRCGHRGRRGTEGSLYFAETSE